jgi:hypothetical protein
MPRGKKGSGPKQVKLVRRHRESGAMEPRRPGRPHPDYELGYVDESGNFQAGNPVKRKGRRGRPAGSKNVAPGLKRGPGRPPASAAGSGLSQIEQIVRREVESRLKSAREAAIAAFTRALGV